MYKNVFKAITAAVLLGSVIGFFVSCQNAAGATSLNSPP